MEIKKSRDLVLLGKQGKSQMLELFENKENTCIFKRARNMCECSSRDAIDAREMCSAK